MTTPTQRARYGDNNIIGHILDHATNPDKLILVFDDHALVLDRDDCLIPPVDPVRTAWDALDIYVRTSLRHAFNECQAVHAIMAVQALTDLEYNEARRALEFPA